MTKMGCDAVSEVGGEGGGKFSQLPFDKAGLGGFPGNSPKRQYVFFGSGPAGLGFNKKSLHGLGKHDRRYLLLSFPVKSSVP